jgi:hypothetical protein
MNEDIIKWAREAVLKVGPSRDGPDDVYGVYASLARFAALVRADEREACAKVAMLVAVNGIETSAAIRERKS